MRKKTATKKTLTVQVANKNPMPYEDYVAVKQKEQQEIKNMEAMMEKQAHPVETTVQPHRLQKVTIASSGTYGGPGPSSYAADNLPGDNLPVESIPGFIATPGNLQNVKAFKKKKIEDDSVYYGESEEIPIRSHSNKRTTYKPKTYSFGEQAYMEPTGRTAVEEQESLPELEASEAKLPNDIEMFDEVRTNLKIIRTSDHTLIYAIVVDKQNELNKAVGIRCYGGVAFGGYVRDCSGDAYLVECCQSWHLGAIPFSYRLEMPKAGNWSVEIPIPERVLESAFTPSQRKTLSELKERFAEDRYEIHYLQMLLAN